MLRVLWDFLTSSSDIELVEQWLARTREFRKIVKKGVKTYAFFNNHYADFAPRSVKLFEDLWEKA